MPKRLLALAVACAAVAAGAPPASASHQIVNCQMRAVQYAGTNVWVGAAVGYIGAADFASLVCVVRVDGEVRARTPAASGAGFAVTAGPVGYERDPWQDVQLCAWYSTSHGSGETCFNVDLRHEVVRTYAEPTLCPVLQGFNGSYGPVEIRPGSGGTGGDVYVTGRRAWDCPTYE